MRMHTLSLAAIYLRLSDEEQTGGESSSISNQRRIIQMYCEQNHITIIREFVDDGYSGGNFIRPGFQEMLVFLDKSKANMVITKDLSRLGRDMREASFYAEQYFPEHGIHYLAISDNFDSDRDNPLAPFQFAMNEVYLRDGSKKVRNVLNMKRESGEYCTCPPYGYRKMEKQARLEPDPITAPVVRRIFELAAQGDSSRKIAEKLDEEGVIPPLLYRALYRDSFTQKGAARASETWNGTTVKRILRNRVYLGHTLLGKTKKVSVKSKMKVRLPEDEWVVHENTHEPLVTQEIFDRAQRNLANHTRAYKGYSHVRKSIFGKIAYCAECGYAMCSGGSVYKGEREKYWYLTCNSRREKHGQGCSGVRIRYDDLMEVVRQDLNRMLSLTEEELAALTGKAISQHQEAAHSEAAQEKLKTAQKRLAAIDKIVGKLYLDNAEGRLSDSRLSSMVEDLEKEAGQLQKIVREIQAEADREQELRENYELFYELARNTTHVETLTRDVLETFIERIEIGPKILPPGVRAATHQVPYRQNITIFYRFIGAVGPDTAKEIIHPKS